MDELFKYQNDVLKSINNNFIRFLYHKIPWEQQMLAIKGPRGTGKTTLMLQRLKYEIKDKQKALYVTVEHPWFLKNSLFNTAQEFYMLGGRTLFIDEVHKYERWSRELKVIYDGFPELQVVFSASSALEIYKGEADLSRRVLSYELPGMSFREYLKFIHGENYDPVLLEHLLSDHTQIAQSIFEKIAVIPLFREYLKIGYLPVTKKMSPTHYPMALYNIIVTVLEQDMQFTDNLSAKAIHKLKRLLGIIAQTVPFEPNVSSIARKIGIGRNTVIEFLLMLEKARIVNFLVRDKFGISAMQKPDKLFLENTNLMFALEQNPNIGSIRETFLMNQLVNAGHKVKYPENGDFIIDNQYIVEVGGKNKKVSDKKIIKVVDDLNAGFANTIPLWLFGFLY